MALFALVYWKQEALYSVISANWVTEPQDICTKKLPVEGFCRWNSGKKTYEASILELSGNFPILPAN